MATRKNLFSLRGLLLRRSKPTPDKKNCQGFTLIELLVAVIIGSVILTTLLYIVVELLQINRREDVLTQTQQDMRRAIDYITRDVGEAVFVYASPAAVVGQLSDLPAGATPVLAFWRLDPVNTGAIPACNTFVPIARQNECTTLKIRQSIYTLVVYLQSNNPAVNNTIWGGRSRILRYELPKYTAAGLNALTQRAGYVDPSINNSFETWTSSGPTAGTTAVLTDFVDTLDLAGGAVPTCPDGPYTATPARSDSFFACVLTGEVQAVDRAGVLRTVNANQSLVVGLRGNADTQNSGFATFNNAGVLPTLEAEVLIRGVIQKEPPSSL
jgi:prepilin-type N-terminal cleavage/methylation domain-containing protein